MFPIFSIINEDLPKRKPSKVSGRDGHLVSNPEFAQLLCSQVASWLQLADDKIAIMCDLFMAFPRPQNSSLGIVVLQLQQTDSLHSQAAAIVAKVIIYKSCFEVSQLEQPTIGCAFFKYVMRDTVQCAESLFLSSPTACWTSGVSTNPDWCRLFLVVFVRKFSFFVVTLFPLVSFVSMVNTNNFFVYFFHYFFFFYEF